MTSRRRTTTRKSLPSPAHDAVLLPPLSLRLYVAGDAPNSVRARGNVTAICDEHFPGGYELEVVDLIDFPRRALEDRIIVTPTLLRLSPLPTHRLIGNLSDTDRVLMVLASR